MAEETTVQNQDERPPVHFLTVDEFKEEIGASTIQVLKNPKTGKLFMSANGNSYKVQQDIDAGEDMKILVPDDGGIEDACLVNVAGGAEEQFTL